MYQEKVYFFLSLSNFHRMEEGRKNIAARRSKEQDGGLNRELARGTDVWSAAYCESNIEIESDRLIDS